MLIPGSPTAIPEAPLLSVQPPWIEEARPAGPWPLLDRESAEPVINHDGEWTFVSGAIARASSMSPPEFSRAVRSLYLLVHDRLRAHGARPVRYWNFIPGIHDPMGGDPSRYMIFNAGRFAAFEEIHGDRREVEHRVATATGVGHAGADLVLHALGALDGGRPVENPRQVPAYRYSARHGPTPPCFARATVVPVRGGAVALIGGTAAVRAEDSVHPGDLKAQVAETFENLDALVGAASTPAGIAPAFRSLRAFVSRRQDLDTVRRAVVARFPGASVECVRADVCRPELLVEIEGIAEF